MACAEHATAAGFPLLCPRHPLVYSDDTLFGGEPFIHVTVCIVIGLYPRL